ncbi:MAG: MFS transporter [Dehalococcoidia bacterium]
MQRPTPALVRIVPFFYGWWVVIALAIIILLTGGTMSYGYSTLIEPLEEEFGWGRAVIGGAASMGAVIGGLTTPVVGYLVDRLGAPRLLVAGVLIMAAGLVCLSQIQAVWALYASIIVAVIGMATAGAPVCMTAIAHWFEKRRGRALAVMAIGAGASGAMVGVLAVLISIVDWRTAVIIVAIAECAICIPLALTVRHRPQELGLLPDGEPIAAPSLPPDTDDVTALARSTAQETGLTVGQALGTRSFWFLAAALLLAWVAVLAIIIHVVAYLDEAAGFTQQGAALVAMGIPSVSLIGRLGFGWLADYVNKQRLLAATFLLQGLGILIFANLHSPWQAVPFLLVFAPGWGGAIPVLPALQAEYFGLRAFGGIQGLLLGIGTVGGIVGPVFAGSVYDMTDTYRPAFLAVALTTLAASLAVLMMGRPPAAEPAPAEANRP